MRQAEFISSLQTIGLTGRIVHVLVNLMQNPGFLRGTDRWRHLPVSCLLADMVPDLAPGHTLGPMLEVTGNLRHEQLSTGVIGDVKLGDKIF
jgi:hypothetical protein